MEAGVVSSSRTARFMMEGVGARVIRGPDWKWGKQVWHFVVLSTKILPIAVNFLAQHQTTH